MCILTDVTPTKADFMNDLTINYLPAHLSPKIWGAISE
jgi:hypothetical protein